MRMKPLFVSLGLAAACSALNFVAPSASAEQSGKTQRVGFICPSVSVSQCRNNNAVQAFLNALRDLGYDENRNLAIEFRAAEGSLDRLPDNQLAMTQELIANMLGVRRGGVTEAATKLQRKGLIRYARGHMTVLDRAGLEKCTCECYGVVRKEYERLLPRDTEI